MSAAQGRAAAQLDFDCGCGASAQVPLSRPIQGEVRCGACGRDHTLHPASVDAAGGLLCCARCGHPELWTRKDFPRALGFTILGAAALLAPFTHYVSLGVAALLDLALYHLVPEVRVCYVCRAEHRRFAPEPRHPRYDPEIADRLRFGAKAVMGKPMRPGGTAGAPPPEH